jgi:hypothetical protein
MTKSDADRLTVIVAAFGLAMSVGGLVVAGSHAALSAAAGSALALVNLLVLRTLVLHLVDGDIHLKLPFLALVFVKMGAMMALVYWAISHGWVEPIAFTVGLSSLVIGLIAGSLFLTRSGSRSEY